MARPVPPQLVRAKGRQRARMPMPPDVGAAVVAYLRDGRQKTTCRRLFVRSMILADQPCAAPSQEAAPISAEPAPLAAPIADPPRDGSKPPQPCPAAVPDGFTLAAIDARFAVDPKCPHCGSVKLGGWGFASRLRRHKCKGCKVTFIDLPTSRRAPGRRRSQGW